ncbi:MAG: PSD1 and planctomycete cytochrome C domain-containing protein [Pirellulaceae bacterium]|nr:PSD1 and planctomycete cytochrome C domain-containing protein [Pirellulaceae bacterium]
MCRFLLPLIATSLVLTLIWPAAAAEPKISFTRQIKPILANRCFVCHGPDRMENAAELRLDLRDEAVPAAIKPGDAEHSEVLVRISSTDPELKMPPVASKKPGLTETEIALIRQWIDQGAEYDAHWSYVPPKLPAIPAVNDAAWPANPIDNFILAKLAARGIAPAPPADRRTLLRRMNFDLIGLPPTMEELNEFSSAAARDPQTAMETVIDRLLASRHFGERMAVYWLDVVRYADTGGYHSDNHRDIAAYRDYVIGAFNANKPFDQFTIEQMAGDLLPGATVEQRIASGYNRLLQTTEEGGAQPKEYTAKYAADRVRNTAAIWLASTMGCCECHSHKFDPFTQTDFYNFAAFFADISEKAVGRQEQTKLPSPEQAAELARIDKDLAAAKAELAAKSPDLTAAREDWEAAAYDDAPKGWPPEVLAALKTSASKRNAKQEDLLEAHFRKTTPLLASARQRVAALEAERAEVDAKIVSTLVSMPVAPRTVRLLPRGNWLDDSGAVAQPGIPAFLASSTVGSDSHQSAARPTRLDLARWIASRDNPLTARVLVNRLWKLLFGRGLSRTLDDFGAQGQLPTHPELLDWLAVDFVEHGWDMKRTFKLMLLSRTYQMSSVPTAEHLTKDPVNDLFSRQHRYRLDAEFVRDNALAVSGLLVPKIGGPSVKPYQPAGYWQYLNFPKREWQNDTGEGLYRRGLYTYWQRTFLHPSLAAFDAPSREECTVERPRSNTPQQALVLLNDPTYVEAARSLAARVLADGKATPERLGLAFRRVLTREPRPDEIAVLSPLLEKHRQEFATDLPAAEKLLAVGASPAPAGVDRAELAAWTSVCRVLLNLHEAVTRN